MISSFDLESCALAHTGSVSVTRRLIATNGLIPPSSKEMQLSFLEEPNIFKFVQIYKI